MSALNPMLSEWKRTNDCTCCCVGLWVTSTAPLWQSMCIKSCLQETTSFWIPAAFHTLLTLRCKSFAIGRFRPIAGLHTFTLVFDSRLLMFDRPESYRRVHVARVACSYFSHIIQTQ